MRPYLYILVAFGLLLSLFIPMVGLTQGDALYVEVVRALDTNDLGVLNPAGLAFSPDANVFFVLEAHSTTQANIITMTPWEELIGSFPVNVARIDPINIAFDRLFNRLLLFDSASQALVAIEATPHGYLDPAPERIARFAVGALGLQKPRGMAVDPVNGCLYVLDSATLQLVCIEPDAEGGFDGAAALDGGRVSWVDLASAGLFDPQGLALNPKNSHFYLLGPAGQRVYELDGTGRLVATLRLPPSEFLDPQALVFALSGDMTDAPSIINLYIADTGLGNGERTGQELGRIMELSLSIVYVPGDAPTIQAGIDLASEGDLVLVAPGIYQESVQLSSKTLTLASPFYTTRDSGFIDQTIIDGGGDTVMTVASSVGPETKVIGFTIRNGNDGVSASASLHILNNHFIGNRDAIDYESGGGICRYNLFEDNRDDAIDLDGPTQVSIENNMIRNSGDDGIEVRLHPYSGPLLNIVIRRNVISGSDEDGIQLIDYPDESKRIFLIERNVIKTSAQVGLGLMDNGVTKEDLRGASIPEQIQLFNNTFIDNNHGLTGGDNLIALNNIFVGSDNLALKNVDGNSVAAYNLFWENGTDYQDSNVDTTSMIVADPRLRAQGQLLPGSAAIDAGIASFTWNSETVLDLAPDEYFGAAPDMGAFETYWLFLPIRLK